MSVQTRAQFWQAEIANWQASGQTGPNYCQQRDLVYHQFVYWRRKLLESELTPSEHASGNPPAGFTRVTQASQPLASASDSGITLKLPSGIAISGLHAGNLSVLSGILRLL